MKLVRANTGEPDTERHDYGYRYDPNGNLTTIADRSPGARVDSYTVEYTGLNQVATVIESKAGSTVNTTRFAYDENGAPTTTSHDRQHAVYGYDVRNLLGTVTNGTSATDPNPKVTTYTYTDRGERLREVKGNGNSVDYGYFLDGLLRTQVEKKQPTGTLVSEHTIDYDLNGNRTRDVTRKMNADNHTAYLTTTADYTYDPRDRVASVTKTGDGAGSETYIHDANNNVINQTVGGVATTFNYDRNRLLTATAGGVTSSYNYDPFGRLDTVTAAGQIIERNVYDGFDHIIENRKSSGGVTSTTRYTFDPLDRTTTKTTDVGTAKQKTTVFNYLGLSGEVLDEEVAGTLTKSYQYSPWGERLSQVKHNTDGSKEDSFYGYNPHTDVEQLTDDTGDTKATYGYTAYGSNDNAQFTGIDKPDAADPTKEPYNAYRFNAKRWDQHAQSYDMGFRDYSPGLNRYLTRDSYNGALADLNLGLNPFTGNRYAFAGGNPISGIELDGHRVYTDGEWYGGATTSGTNQTTTPQPCWEQLTCTRDDIATMSVDDRKQMIQIDDHDGDQEAYLNAIRALLDFAGDKKLIDPGRIGEGNWFSSMDAVILEGVHDGFALSQGKTGTMYTTPGEAERRGSAFSRHAGTTPGTLTSPGRCGGTPNRRRQTSPTAWSVRGRNVRRSSSSTATPGARPCEARTRSEVWICATGTGVSP